MVFISNICEDEFLGYDLRQKNHCKNFLMLSRNIQGENVALSSVHTIIS